MQDQVVLITGAGAGLGQAMAHRFHDAGATVVACDIIDARVCDLAQHLGERVIPMVMDVTSVDDWSQVVTAIQERFGRIDVLINNAGVAVAGTLDQTPLEDWRWVIDIDLMGVVYGCHTVLPMMKAQNSGHIINVASVAGLAGAPEINAYGTAKAAVVAMSEMLRSEVKADGIEVSALCPAFVKTQLTETMRAPNDQFESRVKRWMERSGVSADDVAKVVYDAVQRPRFLLLTHPETRWMWRLKRWVPALYYRMVDRTAARVQKRWAQD